MNDLFKEHEKLVYYVYNRNFRRQLPLFQKHGYDEDDILQVGRMALLQAIERFDASKGKLSTFAVTYIKWSIQKMVRGDVFNLIPIDTELNSGETLESIIEDIDSDYSSDVAVNISFNEFYKTLDSRDKKILSLLASGKTMRETGEIMGTTHTSIRRVRNRVYSAWTKLAG